MLLIAIPTMKTLGGVKSENGVKDKEVSTPNSKPEKIDFSKVKVEPLFEEDVDFDTFSKSDFRAVKVKECVAVPKSKKHRFTKMTGYTSFSQNHIKQ